MPYYTQAIAGEALPQEHFTYRTRRPSGLPTRVWGGVIAIVGVLWLLGCSYATSTPVYNPDPAPGVNP
jgi:hypothetical protein